MAELRGGQLWLQEDFPCHRCFVVYLGGDSWCRIPPPLDGRGCIAYADDAGKVVLSKKEMLARFAEYKYTLKGQYYDQAIRRLEEVLRG